MVVILLIYIIINNPSQFNVFRSSNNSQLMNDVHHVFDPIMRSIINM
jgi:hypothetical protein